MQRALGEGPTVSLVWCFQSLHWCICHSKMTAGSLINRGKKYVAHTLIKVWYIIVCLAESCKGMCTEPSARQKGRMEKQPSAKLTTFSQAQVSKHATAYDLLPGTQRHDLKHKLIVLNRRAMSFLQKQRKLWSTQNIVNVFQFSMELSGHQLSSWKVAYLI